MAGWRSSKWEPPKPQSNTSGLVESRKPQKKIHPQNMKKKNRTLYVRSSHPSFFLGSLGESFFFKSLIWEEGGVGQNRKKPVASCKIQATIIFDIHHRWGPGNQAQMFTNDPRRIFQCSILTAGLQFLSQKKHHALTILTPPSKVQEIFQQALERFPVILASLFNVLKMLRDLLFQLIHGT